MVQRDIIIKKQFLMLFNTLNNMKALSRKTNDSIMLAAVKRLTQDI